jgi:hypothetical protein
VQCPVPTRLADLSSTSLRDLLAGDESPLTPLVHARFGVGQPEQFDRPCANAPAALPCGQALVDRLMAMRCMTATHDEIHPLPDDPEAGQ